MDINIRTYSREVYMVKVSLKQRGLDLNLKLKKKLEVALRVIIGEH